MADKNPSNPIPDGWIWNSKQSCYQCPVTKQHFDTYEDLMHYVNHAKKEKLSFYSPDFDASKLKKDGLQSGRSSKSHVVKNSGSKLSRVKKAGSHSRKCVLGQSSKSSAVEKCFGLAMLDLNEKSMDWEDSALGGNAELEKPAEGSNEKSSASVFKADSLPGQAELEAKQVQLPGMESIDQACQIAVIQSNQTKQVTGLALPDCKTNFLCHGDRRHLIYTYFRRGRKLSDC